MRQIWLFFSTEEYFLQRLKQYLDKVLKFLLFLTIPSCDIAQLIEIEKADY